jgi:hypothetical protein
MSDSSAEVIEHKTDNVWGHEPRSLSVLKPHELFYVWGLSAAKHPDVSLSTVRPLQTSEREYERPLLLKSKLASTAPSTYNSPRTYLTKLQRP